MPVAQSRFRAALLDAAQPVPDGLQDGQSNPAGARFSVYRNNVVVSLSEALATAFPLVRKLLGTQTFDRLAGVYVRLHPPTSPLMMHYGADMPQFLHSFEPLKHIGYLADCAKLDLAFRQSYHAADAAPFDPAIFQTAPQAALAQKVDLAPATRIIISDWPLFDIWRFNTEPDAPKPQAGPQCVLLTRPEYDPHPHLIPLETALWLQMLDAGETFANAVEEITNRHPAFDLTQALTLALTTSALTEHPEKETQ